MRNYNKEKLTDKDKALLRYVDNVKNDDPATMKMIAEYDPYGKKNKRSPDVYEISEQLNKFRAKNDQLPTYNSTLGTFEKGDKRGPLSTFKETLAADQKAADYEKILEKDYREGKIFSNAINRMKIKGPKNNKRRLNDMDIFYAAADPKEKAELRKSYKDYNFEKKAFKADLYKAQLLKPIVPNKVEPKVEIEEPPIDVRKLIEDRARAAAEIKRQQIVKDLGDKGLGNLRLKMEGLDE